MLENQVEVRQREVVELQSQVKALGQEVKDTEEVDGRRQLLERKFQELLDPLRRRRNFLVASREVHQFNRDVEDEIVRNPTSCSLRCQEVDRGDQNLDSSLTLSTCLKLIRGETETDLFHKSAVDQQEVDFNFQIRL